MFSAANWMPPFFSRGQGPAVPRVQRGKTRRRARPFPRPRPVRPVLHPGPGDHRAVPRARRARRAFRGGRNRLAQARPVVPRRRRRRPGAARRRQVPAGGAVRFHLHRTAERGAASARRDRGGNRARRALLAAYPASEMRAGTVRPLPGAGRRQRRLRRTGAIVAAQRAADVLLSDTTSVVPEFVVQHKPVVTFRNRAPKPHMLDFDDPAQLHADARSRLRADPRHCVWRSRYAEASIPSATGIRRSG